MSSTHTYKSSCVPVSFSEIEFSSFLQNDIEVVMQARLPELSLFGSRYGPFVPGESVVLPIWIAQEFERHGWIRIEMLPQWMVHLSKSIEQEKQNASGLSAVPADYIVVGRWICEHLARHDSSGTESSRYELLLRDLTEIRSSKVFGKSSQSLNQLLDFQDGFKFGHMDTMEVNNRRTLILDALHMLSEFDAPDDADDE